MKVKLFTYYFLVENKRFFRYWQNIFFVYIYPIILVGLFGMIFQSPQILDDKQPSYLDYALPGYLSIIVLSSLFLGVFGEFLSWRKMGVVNSFARTPLNFWWLTSITALANIIHTLLAQLTTLMFAVLVFGVKVPALAPFILYLLLLIISVYSFSYFFHVLIVSDQLSSIVRFTLFFTVMFLSGAAIPIEIFPPMLKKVAQFFPLNYGIDLLKTLWGSATQRSLNKNLLALLAFSLGFLLLSVLVRSLRLQRYQSLSKSRGVSA